MHYVVSLFVFVVVFVERTVSRQSHSDSTRLGWRMFRWSDMHSSSNFECIRADSDRYDTIQISRNKRVSRWYALHKVVPVRFALLWWSSSFSSTTCIETTLQKNHFSIISLKVVSQRSVFVTFDLIVVTKILEHKWQSDRRRRTEVRQDSETQQRNYVKVICAKCRLTSSKSRVQEKITWWLYGRPIKFYWLNYLENSMRRSGRKSFHQYNHELSVFSWLCVFSLLSSFQIIEIIFTLIFKNSLLFDCFQESSVYQISLNPVEEYEIANKLNLDMTFFKIVRNDYKKHHPTT